MATAISLIFAALALGVAIMAHVRASKLSAALAERAASRQPEAAPEPPEPANDAKWAEFDALHRAKFERAMLGDDDVVANTSGDGAGTDGRGNAGQNRTYARAHTAEA